MGNKRKRTDFKDLAFSFCMGIINIGVAWFYWPLAFDEILKGDISLFSVILILAAVSSTVLAGVCIYGFFCTLIPGSDDTRKEKDSPKKAKSSTQYKRDDDDVERIITSESFGTYWQQMDGGTRRNNNKADSAEDPSRSQQVSRYHAAMDTLAAEIEKQHLGLTWITDYRRGYMTRKDFEQWREQADDVLRKFARIPDGIVRSHPTLGKKAMEIRRWHSTPGIFEDHKGKFIEWELRTYSTLFQDVGGPGKNLDREQAKAVITCEDSTLVVAGAGSGKTLTVVGKIKYLINRYHVLPREIIVLSFTRASSKELANRLSTAGVEGVIVKDFHALGLSLIDGKPGVANESLLESCVRSYLEQELILHPDQTRAVLEVYGYRSEAKAHCRGSQESVAPLFAVRASDMRTIRGIMQGAQLDMNTMKGERVKSFDELVIANFLYLNGVEYEYEKVYTEPIPGTLDDGQRHRAYQPDFYLVEYDIWLEHFGIDERGRASFLQTPGAQKRYEREMAWKRELHKTCGTRLIESYHYWFRDQVLVNRLEDVLRDSGVKLGCTSERITEMYAYLSADKNFCDELTRLTTQFIRLCKTNNISSREADERARRAFEHSGFLRKRYRQFATFAFPAYDYYQSTLEERGEIDFEDMINKATDRIVRDGYAEACRYIIVDEFQDTSAGRFALVQAIRRSTGAKLMCVGDDWQSIFRFTGSDIGLFTHFEEHAGNCEVVKLSRTYRNSQELADIANGFIMKNEAQLKKDVESSISLEKPVLSMCVSDHGWAFTRALDMALEDSKNAGIDNPSILVMGRNNADIDRAIKEVQISVPQNDLRKSGVGSNIILSYKGHSNIRFMTVHRSKGLEADYAIILNAVNDMLGFPNLITDDPIIEFLLDNGDNYPLAEERRLFYVALTRARRKVWIIADSPSGAKGPSPFVEEIATPKMIARSDKKYMKCPSCGGRIIRKTNSRTGKEFLGCVNYPACEQSYNSTDILDDAVSCPECGGWMVLKHGTNSSFYGCTNYPVCKATLSVEN